MTVNTPLNADDELDEILFEAIEAAATYTHNVTAEEADYIQNKAKQAILDWHNKQVKNAVVTAEDNLDQYWNKELDKQVEEAMAKFHLKKGVKYDVKASDSVIVITHTNKLKERDDDQL